MAIGQLNVLLGAVDVPGGIVNASGAGPDWMPRAEQDGLMVPGNPYHGASNSMLPALPRRTVRQPQTLELMELFPVSVYARTMLWLGLLRGEEFGLPYKAEVLIQARCNIMSTSGDPAVMADALRTIPFVVSMNTFHDETTEFADLLLPDTHALERLAPLVHNPYLHYASAAQPHEPYSWNFQQPVVKAVPAARHWGEVLVDLIERLGLVDDFNTAFNGAARLRGDHRLERGRRYTWEELADRWTKSVCGDDHGLDYFREHGYYQGERRSIRSSYPRPFHEARIPLYLEHFIDAGEAVDAFTRPLNIEWDTSDYMPLVEWKPCLTPREAPAEFDLWVVNQKLPFMTFSFTAENPWLEDLAERNGKVFTIGINASTAGRKGIRDGDQIELLTPDGKRAEGRARVTEGVHPDCLVVPGILGRWATGDPRARGRGVHFNGLMAYSLDRMDTVAAALDACVKVRVARLA
jgi:molybdopterin-containing oxidoreductase family molybdopterin binding subunit